MKYAFLTLAVLLSVTTVGSAAIQWVGATDYVGWRQFDQFADLTAVDWASERSLRFTAPSAMTVRTIKLDFSIKNDASVTAVVSLRADSSGDPGTVLASSPSTAIGASQVAFTLASDVGLTASSVYHVHIAYTSPAGEKVRMYIRPQYQNYNQIVEDGRLATDSQVAGLSKYTGTDPNIGAGWHDGKPAEIHKQYDPCFGLYSDQAGSTPVGGVGYDSTSYERSYNGDLAESFILSSDLVPAGQISGGQVGVDKVAIPMQAVQGTPGDLLVKILDANDTEVARGTKAAGLISGGDWANVSLDGGYTFLTIGNRYTVVASVSGTNEYSNRYDIVVQNYDNAVPKEHSFQGTQGYFRGVGGTLPPDDTRDMGVRLRVPEPATVGLLAIGGLGVLLRRRRR
jgi:hypothetical protein